MGNIRKRPIGKLLYSDGKVFGTLNSSVATSDYTFLAAPYSDSIFQIDTTSGKREIEFNLPSVTDSFYGTPNPSANCSLSDKVSNSIWVSCMYGGKNNTPGVFYKLNISPSTKSYSWSSPPISGDWSVSSFPFGALTYSDGYFWGTSIKGVNGGYLEPNIFKIHPATNISSSGQTPSPGGVWFAGELTDTGDGNLWGMSYDSEIIGAPTINLFSLNKSTGVISMHPQDKAVFLGGYGQTFVNGKTLAVGDNFDLWGTTLTGATQGTSGGLIFTFNRQTQSTSILHTFGQMGSSGCQSGDGCTPMQSLTDDGNGNFYGITQRGGAYNFGTIYKINKATGAYALLHSFTGGEGGKEPMTNLVNSGDGYMWGTTSYGGSQDLGIVYKIRID